MTLALSYQYVHKNSVACFHFEQLSMIPVVSLLLTFNKYTASGVFFFQYIFMFQNIISRSKHWCASGHLRRNKQKTSAGKFFFYILLFLLAFRFDGKYFLQLYSVCASRKRRSTTQDKSAT